MTELLGKTVEDDRLLKLQFGPGRGAPTVQWLVSLYCLFVHREGKLGVRLCVKNLRSFLASQLVRLRGSRAEALINGAFLDNG